MKVGTILQHLETQRLFDHVTHKSILISPKLVAERLITPQPLQFPCQQADTEYMKESPACLQEKMHRKLCNFPQCARLLLLSQHKTYLT